MVNLILSNWEAVLTVILLAWYVSTNEYLEALLDEILERLEGKRGEVVVLIVYEVLTCVYCASFWFSFSFFLVNGEGVKNAFLLAVGASFIAYVGSKIGTLIGKSGEGVE